MAINPNNALPLRHVCYCGASGAGKTVAVKQGGKVGKCAAILDPYGDYLPGRLRTLSGLGNGRRVHHYTTRRGFLAAFADAWKSGKGFAVAYTPKVADSAALRQEAIWFANVIWAAGDGKRELHAVFEETGKYVETAGAERSRLGELATGGRKFGIVCHWVFQRPSEVPKTIISMSAEQFVGAQQAIIDAKRWQTELDCGIDEIIALGKQNMPRKKFYLHKTEGIGNYRQIALSF